MHHTVLNQHLEFFIENGYIGFEELVDPWEIELTPGRDLWRTNEAVAKLTCSRKLARIVVQLLKRRPIRLAFDQLMTGGSGTLEEISSVQGLECGLLIQPSGDGVFFKPDHPMEFSEGLLIAYAGLRAVYAHNSKDPYTNLWKRLGINFGDRLEEPEFPIMA
jgi:hypothetical protein